MNEVFPRFKQPRSPNLKRGLTAAQKRPGMDPKYLEKIRRLPSCVSGRGPCEAHHLRVKGERGVGLKATDRWAVPLTPDEHRDVHTVGSRKEEAWFKQRGLDCYALTYALWSNRYSEDSMLAVLAAHRGKA